MSEIETRSLELRLENLEERTIVGLAVPYNQDANIGGVYNERFVPGAIDSVEDVKLFYGHETPIGVVTDGRETNDGYEITAKVSETSLGNDVLTLMRDGALNKFSVGFVPVSQEQDGSTITRTKVSLKEVSVVPFPAYAGASITEVRDEEREIVQPAEPTPTPIKESESELENSNIELDVRSVQDEVAELRRVVESSVSPVAPSAPEYMKYRSFGEYAQAFAKGDAAAIELARAASTSADTYAAPGYIGYINKLIQSNRPSWNVWSTNVLPATGMTAEYAAITGNTLAVGEQDPENEALSFGNLTIASVSTPVKTYGGYTTVSKQALLRGSVDFAGIAFDALAVAYANATNTAAKTKLASLNFTGKVFDLDGGTAASVIEGLIDAIKYIKVNSGLNAEFILCSAAAYKYFMKIADSSGRPIVNVNNDGSNTFATANNDLTGTIWGIPVVVDPTLSDSFAILANSRGLLTMESNGSGTRLTSEDVSTLTDTLSLYGFAAIAAPFESAIVQLDITA
jgi:HK97 family phage prohead protease/HK97 family phage major capsid protein